MQLDALAIRLRPRRPIEAADLGVALCQSAARSVYPSYLMAALPVIAVALATSEIAGWLPATIIWCVKPWLDRTILFVLSRAAFGRTTSPLDVWREQRQVWWSQLLRTLILQRLSLWRSLTQPVYQLEGGSFWTTLPRVRQLRLKTAGPAALVTNAFSLAEQAITAGLVSLVFWLAPSGMRPDLSDVLGGNLPGLLSLTVPLSYAAAVLFLEPFYVAAGFAMYLNRRADLEAWDVEQELRRAFRA